MVRPRKKVASPSDQMIALVGQLAILVHDFEQAAARNEAAAEHARASADQLAGVMHGVTTAIATLQKDVAGHGVVLHDHGERIQKLERPAREAVGA